MASLWRIRFDELAPRPVALPATLGEMMRLRLEAPERFYVAEKDGARAAGFVTNCYPQDGAQLSNVFHFGFTGPSNLTAFNLLRAGGRLGDAEQRRKALRVMTFFVEMPDARISDSVRASTTRTPARSEVGGRGSSCPSPTPSRAPISKN